MSESNLDKAQRLLNMSWDNLMHMDATGPARIHRAVTQVSIARGYVELETARMAERAQDAGAGAPPVTAGYTPQEKSEDAALRELASINQALRNAGFEYPTGVRGVRDVIRLWEALLAEKTPEKATDDDTRGKLVGAAMQTHRPGQVLCDRDGDHWYVCGYDDEGRTLLAETERDDDGMFRAQTGDPLFKSAYPWNWVRTHYGPLVWGTNGFVSGFGMKETIV
jgi:hypothetical protein